MNAAVGFRKHSLTFGHLASSQTVARPYLLNIRFVSWSLRGFFVRIHSGRRTINSVSSYRLIVNLSLKIKEIPNFVK